MLEYKCKPICTYESGYSSAHYHLICASWLSFLVKNCMKNNELTVFSAGNLKTTALTTDDGTVWFVAKDLADSLGYSAARDMTRMLDDDERLVHNVLIRSANDVVQTREVLLISESGMYACIFGSRKEEAKRFRKWVTSEVLPQIRKTGQYAPSRRKQFLLECKQTCIDGLRTMMKLTHRERVAVVRELLMEQDFNISHLLASEINDDLRYFSEAEVAKRGNYLSVAYLRENLELAGLTEGGGYFSEEGRKYGRVNETGNSEWRLDVLEYIADYFETFFRKHR